MHPDLQCSVEMQPSACRCVEPSMQQGGNPNCSVMFWTAMLTSLRCSCRTGIPQQTPVAC